MTELEKKVTELNIDRSDWELVKFGDIAVQQKQKVDRENTYLTRYVKGEHMHSEDLHLREWGELTDEYLGPAFIRKFEEGDILYGSRRTYLRKVVIAPFEGITSNTTFVVKANESKIDKRLLPFIMLSEGFTQHSIKNSKGSVNPYINWKDLASYEFLLPPMEQQFELYKLLSSIDDVLENELQLVSKLNTLRKSYMGKFQTSSSNWEKVKIKQLMNFNYGKPLKESERLTGDYQVVSSSGVQGTHNDFVVEGPGIVVGRKGNVGEITWVENSFWPIDTAYYVTLKKEYHFIPLKFIFFLLQSTNFKKFSIATAVPGLNRDDALSMNVYIPAKNEIPKIVSEFEEIDNRKTELDLMLDKSKKLKKSIINQVF